MVGGLSLCAEKSRRIFWSYSIVHLTVELDTGEIQHQLHHAKHRQYEAQREQQTQRNKCQKVGGGGV